MASIRDLRTPEWEFKEFKASFKFQVLNVTVSTG